MVGIHRLWRAVEHATAVANCGVRPGIARALSIIREDPACPNSLVARLAGVSLDYLGVLFRRQVGVTMSRYRNVQRL